VNLAKLVAEILDTRFEVMKPLFCMMLDVFPVSVACSFMQSTINVLSEFVRLPFQLLSRLMKTGFVQMTNRLVQQFQSLPSMLVTGVVFGPAAFAMPFSLVRRGTLNQFSQLPLNGFRPIRLTSFPQLGNVLAMSLNLDFQLETAHAPFDLAFDFFRF